MNKKILFLGITLFSMFFGAGNLIFSPFMGVQAAGNTPLALAGLILTAVFCPIAAIMIIAPYHSARNLASSLWKPLGPIFMTLVYLLIGPCIAIPRTASTALEMWQWLFHENWMNYLFVVVFFVAAYFMAKHPGKLKDLLGKILGPLLIGLILFLCIPLLFKPEALGTAQNAFETSPFFTGLNEGYQTMDILAACCFGTIMLINIKQANIKNETSALKKAALIAGILLASIYSLLAFSTMKQSANLQNLTNGAQILSAAAQMCWGGFGQILCGMIFLIACLNVCASLIACCSEYFSELIPALSYSNGLLLFSFTGILLAATGLDSILSWSGKLLSIICPLAILILAAGLIRYLILKKQNSFKA